MGNEPAVEVHFEVITNSVASTDLFPANLSGAFACREPKGGEQMEQ